MRAAEPSTTCRPARFAICLAVLVVGLKGCGGNSTLELGQPVPLSSAVPLSQFLRGDAAHTTETVVVSGRVREVCRSSGCWLVIDDMDGTRVYELLVDLKPSADFTVKPNIIGRRAVVSGRLAGSKPDLRLNAVGLVVQ